MNTEGNELYLQITQNYLPREYNSKLFEPNSIVYPKNGGAVFTNKKRILKYESVVDLNTGVFTPYSPIDLMFMYWLFTSIDFKKYYKGTALPTVDKKRMDNLFFGLPPLEEQKRIVSKIEELMPLIEKYGKLEENLEDLNTNFPDLIKKSILQEAIQGRLVPQDPNDEPASVLLEKIRQEKEQLIKDKKIKINKNESIIYRENNHFYEKIDKKEPICIDDEIPFDIPNNWEWCRLITVNNIFNGNSINKTEKETKFMGLIEGYNYIATKDVKFDCSINYDNGVKIPKGFEKFRIAKKNSILLCIEGGSAGRKIAVTEEDICFGNKLACFISYGINNKFLFYYLQSPLFKKVFKSKTTGIIGGVGIGKLRTLFLPVPPLKEQERIVNKIEELEFYLNKINKFL